MHRQIELHIYTHLYYYIRIYVDAYHLLAINSVLWYWCSYIQKNLEFISLFSVFCGKYPFFTLWSWIRFFFLQYFEISRKQMHCKRKTSSHYHHIKQFYSTHSNSVIRSFSGRITTFVSDEKALHQHNKWLIDVATWINIEFDRCQRNNYQYHKNCQQFHKTDEEHDFRLINEKSNLFLFLI